MIGFLDFYRIYSNVLLENCPQLILQLFYLIYIDFNFIAGLAMVFSFLSILLSFLEFCSQHHILGAEIICVVKFEIFSNKIGSSSPNNFHKLSSNRSKLERAVGKMLNVDYRTVELLKPIQTNSGLEMIYHLRDKIINDQINQMQNEINNDTKEQA